MKMVLEDVLCERETSTNNDFDKYFGIYFVYLHGYSDFWASPAKPFPSTTKNGSKIRKLFDKANESKVQQSVQHDLS